MQALLISIFLNFEQKIKFKYAFYFVNIILY